MHRKLIFFDIDGTLIAGGSQKIPDSAIRAIEQARANGHLCFINTGRTKPIVGEEITGQTVFDGLLLGCGTMILYHGELLFHRSIPAPLGEKIVRGIRKYRMDALLEGAEKIYGPSLEQMFTDTFRNYVNPSGGEFHVGALEDAPGRFDKFFGYIESRERAEALQRELGETLEFIDRGDGFYEVVPDGYSKATGIRFMTDYLHIPMEDTVAIGDSSNDLPMFTCAGCGIAMEQSADAVLQIADHVTTDVWQDGIWNALSWLGVLDERAEEYR